MESHASSSADLKAGDQKVLTIVDIAFGGEGVGRIDDFVLFVPFVALHEEVEVEILEVKKRFARARRLRILKPSPERVLPPCPYFGDCGGCQYQHIGYRAQLEIKRKQIGDLFQRVGGFSTEVVAPVIPCPQPYEYRNRIMIRSQWDKFKQGLNIGFIRADNRLVVDIEECKISEPALNQEITRVRRNPPPKGGIKVVLRVPPENWELPPDSFFQNNFFLLPELVNTVRSTLRSSESRFLVDAYCGVGFFSIECADLVDRFVGVELDGPAIKAARRNAERRKISNGEFVCGRTEEVLSGLLAKTEAAYCTVLIDPPRTGCPLPMIEFLRQSGVRQVIYVSCHPATLARDLNILCANNVFELKNVVPLDMFPQTQHVECVADVRLATQKA